MPDTTADTPATPEIDWFPEEFDRSYPNPAVICLNMGVADEATITFFAFRYALPRDTTAPYIVVPWIIANWHRFPTHDRVQMQKEIRDQFERRPGMLADCIALWQQVLDLVA